MKSERYLDEEATIKKGVEALIRELGPVEAMRFLSIPQGNAARRASSAIVNGKRHLTKRSFLMRFLDRPKVYPRFHPRSIFTPLENLIS